MTTWTPDTCYNGRKDHCKIEIIGDWENPSSVKSLKKCSVHAALDNGAEHFYQVWKRENQIKNYSFDTILAELAGVSEEMLDSHVREEANIIIQQIVSVTLDEAIQNPEAQGHVQMAMELAKRKLGLGSSEYSWSFDMNRALNVSLPERITPSQKNKIQTACSNKYGQGKVKIT